MAFSFIAMADNMVCGFFFPVPTLFSQRISIHSIKLNRNMDYLDGSGHKQLLRAAYLKWRPLFSYVLIEINRQISSQHKRERLHIMFVMIIMIITELVKDSFIASSGMAAWMNDPKEKKMKHMNRLFFLSQIGQNSFDCTPLWNVGVRFQLWVRLLKIVLILCICPNFVQIFADWMVRTFGVLFSLRSFFQLLSFCWRQFTVLFSFRSFAVFETTKDAVYRTIEILRMTDVLTIDSNGRKGVHGTHSHFFFVWLFGKCVLVQAICFESVSVSVLFFFNFHLSNEYIIVTRKRVPSWWCLVLGAPYGNIKRHTIHRIFDTVLHFIFLLSLS